MKPTNDATRASVEAMPYGKPDLLDIADIIHRARLLVSCICMASASLRGNERDAISIVGDAAIDKLVEARNALEAICEANQGRATGRRAVVSVGHALSEMLANHAEIVASINRHEGEPDHPEVVALCKRQVGNAMAIIGYRPLTMADVHRKAEFLREWTEDTALEEEEQNALIASMLPKGGAK